MKSSLNEVKAPYRLYILCLLALIGLALHVTYTGSSLPARRLIFDQPGALSTPNGDKYVRLKTDSEEDKSPSITEKVLCSSWIKYFPNLKSTLESTTIKCCTDITSALETKLTISKYKWKQGAKLTANISTYLNDGQKKTYGGDFILAKLDKPDTYGYGISCQVHDHDNGLYTIQCYLPWEGDASLKVYLMLATEGIYALLKRHSSEEEFGTYMNTTMQTEEYKVEYTRCTIGFPGRSEEDLCDYSNKHGEKRTCLKPPSGKCSNITWQERHRNKTALALRGVHFQKGLNTNAQISGSGMIFSIERDFKTELKYQNTSSLDPMKPTGWFQKHRWIYFETSNTRKVNFSECMTNKRLYFIGDSTMYQWFSYFRKLLRVQDYGPDNSVAWSQGRDAEEPKLNLTLHYRAHGIPLHSPGPDESRPYISNTLDSITYGGDGSIVFITFGYHFPLYETEVFTKRAQIVKKAAISLIQRLPGIKIVIKGLHYHRPSTTCPNVWVTYKFEVILRHIFHGIANLIFFEVWDMSFVANNQLLHPEDELLRKIIWRLLLSIC